MALRLSPLFRQLRWRLPLHGHLIWLSGLLIGVTAALTLTVSAWHQSANAIERAWWLGALLLCTLASLFWLTRRLSRSLRRLAGQARATRDFHFAGEQLHSFVSEVDELAASIAHMRTIIQRFLGIATGLVAERQFPRLMQRIVSETMATVEADAVVLYLAGEHELLEPTAWHHRQASDPLPHPIAIDGRLPLDHPLHLARTGSKAFEARYPPVAPPQGMEWLTAWFPGRPVCLLTLPLLARDGEAVVAVLCLVRPGEEAHFAADTLAFISALSSIMAVAIDHQRLFKQQQDLFDALIRTLAGAIDARSPHTGGHCQRVPELAHKLADLLTLNDDERETIGLAAWLHDCGKVAIPEHVADKATRLATVYDRIHEIRTRCEVIKREAEVACWRAIAEGADRQTCLAKLAKQWHTLDEDFAFLAACNNAAGELSEADLARLKQISRHTWTRTLDDRLGISAEELARKGRTPPRHLPTQEHLLVDRLEHLIDFLPGEALAQKPPDGRSPPRHKLNLGELYNLMVRRGTLTVEERYLIEAHVVQTRAMLEKLPFPRHLCQTPAIAGGHHEHPDGSGYPQGIGGGALPLGARLLAIADIFEALTASDRPYKPGKTIAEALGIMADMVRCDHLDGALFARFVHSGIAEDYGQRFLKAEQRMAYDPQELLRRAGLDDEGTPINRH